MSKAQMNCIKQKNSWANLDLNLLGEIKKKLFWGDHARFSGVCKTWLAAEHEKRAGDVLPWWLLLDEDEFVNRITYQLYQPLNLHQPVITRGIDLDKFFDTSSIHMASLLTIYLDGCLLFSMYHSDYSCTQFLLVSILADRVITLPQFLHPFGPPGPEFLVLKGVSTCPASPDCVFLALHVGSYHHWTIGIFRHGEAHWTTTEFIFAQRLGRPLLGDIVFIRGVFYIFCSKQRLASYDIASGELKINSFSIPTTDYGQIFHRKLFELDGDLMLMYEDTEVRRKILSRYDWSHKLWVPLKSLGDRSLFISDDSVYADSINYYGASPNMIYYQQNETCSVYSFENGELIKSTASGLRNWDGLDYGTLCSLWVEPPALLSKQGTSQQMMTLGGYNGRRPIEEVALQDLK